MSSATNLLDLNHRVRGGDRSALARLLSLVERGDQAAIETTGALPTPDDAHVIGFTGAPGAGKSTLIDAAAAVLRAEGSQVGILAVDPSSPYSGGALLGDRVRMMQHVGDSGVFIRSLANRGYLGGLSATLPFAVRALTACGFTTVLVETVGVGQAEVDIASHADTTVVVTSPGTGDAVQTAKAGVLEIADVLVVNKADRPGVQETTQHLKEMLRRTHYQAGDWRKPVIATHAEVGEGITDLVKTIGTHRDHLCASGEMCRRRNERSLASLRAYATARLLNQIEQALAGWTGRRIVQRVTNGEVSPASAADELLASITMEPNGS